MDGSIEALEVAEDEEYDWWEENCGIIRPDDFRIVLILYVGSAVAAISVVFNVFLFLVLATNRRHRASSFLYLAFLAFADIFLSAAYILLFPVNIAMDLFESELLARAWYFYMRPVLTLSHVAITSSAFFIVAAAFERLITICRLGPRLAHHHRKMLCVGVLMFAFLTKGPMYFEVEVVDNGNCTGATAQTAQVSPWSESEPYKTAYKFWFRNIFTIFVPFFLIVLINARIVHRLREQHHGAQLFRFATSEHRQNIRSATQMLVFVCCTYLASNSLAVIVNAWEFINKESLFTDTIRPFYTASSDLISFFTVLASACRLPIYTVCNSRIRGEVFASLICVSVALYPRCLPGARKMSNKKVSRPVASTIRYCETGNGFMIYETQGPTPTDEMSPQRGRQSRCIGTGFDKVILSVAIGKLGHEQSGNLQEQGEAEEHGNLLTPNFGSRRVKFSGDSPSSEISGGSFDGK